MDVPMNAAPVASPPPMAVPLKKGIPLWIKLLIALVVAVLILVGFWMWLNRPIRPVLLSASEKAAVEAKVDALQRPVPATTTPAEPTYEKGGKEIILTERELNGLLNENTPFGKTVCFELATNAVHARVETDLDPEIPLVGGKHLKARARFLVGSDPKKASLVLDDVTVWGISLPNDWLAGLKGQDLLAQTLGSTNTGAKGGIPGVEEFKIEPGRLVIRLAE